MNTFGLPRAIAAPGHRPVPCDADPVRRATISPMPATRAPLRGLLLLASLLGAGCDSDPVEARFVTLEATPAALTFAAVPVGVADESVVFIANRGNGPWMPEAPPVLDGAGFVWVSGCDAPVGPQETCELRVRFAPVAEGGASGSVAVSAPGVGLQGSDVDVVIPLAGTGAAPVLLLTPPSLDFGALAVDDFAVQVITAENVGPERLTFDLVTSSEDYRVAGDTRASLRLAPGERRELNVTFQPRRGGPIDGAVVAEVCGPGCGLSVALRGSGAAPRLETEPRFVELGAVDVGDEAEVVVTLRNTGTGVLRIDGVDLLSGTDDLQLELAEELPLGVDDGDSVNVTLRYAPTTGRAALGAMLVVRSNDPLSPEVFVPVDGQTVGPGLEVLPGVAHFGRLDDGDTRDLTLIVRAVGTDPVDNVSITLEGTGFSFVQAPPPGPLQPGQALQLGVRAAAVPAAVTAGGSTGRLVASGDGVVASADLAFLAGTAGCVPVAAVPHLNLGFVPVRSGASGAVVVENIGDAPCRLVRFEPGGRGLGFDPDFSIAPQGLSTLAPGQSGRVQFAFAGTRPGARQTVVELGFDGVAAPVFVSAGATVIEGSLGTFPASVALGPVALGCDDPTAVSSVVNTGGTTLGITNIRVDPPDAPFVVSANNLPIRLLPGASRAVSVEARTTDAGVGSHTAVVTFETDVGISTTLQISLEVVADADAVEETFTIAPASAVDILFIIDNSGSMFDDQALLAENFQSFFEVGLLGGAPSFQVGVTTTDVLSEGAARGRLVGSPAILDAGTPELESAFAANVLVGIDGAGLELGLEALRLALEHPDNSRFLRRDAALSVVFVTDEEDAGAFPGDLPDAALARDPADYIAFLEAVKGGTVGNAPILVSGIVVPGVAIRYESLVRYFGGTILDIQTANWGERLADVGNATFSLVRSFRLGAAPAAASLVVELDGNATTDFTFDVARQTVILDEAPRAGAEVVIRYRSGCQ